MIKIVFLFKVESDEGLIRLRGGGRLFRGKKNNNRNLCRISVFRDWFWKWHLNKKTGKSESAPIYHQTKLQYLMPLKKICTLNVWSFYSKVSVLYATFLVYHCIEVYQLLRIDVISIYVLYIPHFLNLSHYILLYYQ